MNPLKIEVTEAMRDTAMMAARFSYEESDEDDRAYSAAIEAVLRHPHLLAQVREQVMGCVPEDAKKAGEDEFAIKMGCVTAYCTIACGIGYNIANNRARANLAGLLGDGDG